MRSTYVAARLYGGEVTLELAEKLITEAAGREDELALIQHGLMYLWNLSAPGEKIMLEGRRCGARQSTRFLGHSLGADRAGR
jgi:hypothetical protein